VALWRARSKCQKVMLGLLGIALVGGITTLILWLAGVIKTSEDMGCDGTVDDDMKPTETTLCAWLSIPPDTIFDFILEQAEDQDEPWGIATWAYVMAFLATATFNAVPDADKDDVKAQFVHPAQASMDFAALEAADTLTPRTLVEKSADYPPAGVFDDKPAYRLAVRFEYLSYLFQGWESQLDDE
jgi:hypothetical protein